MKNKLNSFHLKVIAIIAMPINHIGSGFILFEYPESLFFSWNLLEN